MSEAAASSGAAPSSSSGPAESSHSKAGAFVRRISKTRQNSVSSSQKEDAHSLGPTKSEPSLRKGSEVAIEPESSSGGAPTNTEDRGHHFQHRDSFGPNHVDSPRITRKIIHNWRQACDRTKDRTKELLKRWRTLPDGEHVDEDEMSSEHKGGGGGDPPTHSGWSVHIWSTWVKRAPNDQEDPPPPMVTLSKTQNNKLTHFFTHLLDWDRDETISECDFDALSERLRHFADWSTNSPEFFVLKEVEFGFQEEFLFTDPTTGRRLPQNARSRFQTTSLDDWLIHWSRLIHGRRNIQDLPIWLQYFAKIIFQVINKSGSDIISRDELRMYFSTFLALDTQTVGETLDLAYNNMTSNGENPLTFKLFKWCFENFFLGRNPHGCGQFLFGPFPGMIEYSTMFPIDYSAMNTPPECLEQYSPFRKSKRHSVIV